jgi:hypothetical protein
MKKLFLSLFIVLCLAFNNYSQTPVHLASQSGFTYTETFADINNWVFNTAPTDGTFTAGIGASAWKGIDATTTTPAVPNATRVTAVSNFFQTPTGSGIPIYSSGVYKGTQSISILSTGSIDNSSAIAMDFFLDFTSVNAGTLSFDWASLNNNSGNRMGSLRVYASIDGVSFSEITTAQVLNFVNFSPTAGSVINVNLPSIFNGSATARLRFYYHNGTGGTAGSRPRINLDNVKITAFSTAPCATPIAQPTGFTLGIVTNNQVPFSFIAASPTPQNYLVVMSKNTSLTANPVNNTIYNVGDNLGDGTVVAITNTNITTITGLTNSTTYYFFIFSMNNVCTGGPLYFSTNPLQGSATTLAGPLPCAAPIAQPINLVFSNITTTSVSGSFTAATNTSEYLVIRSLSPTFTGTLNNGSTYNSGLTIGNGTVVTRTSGTTFTSINLLSGTTYYYFVFGLNNTSCNGGPVYRSLNPLTASITTIALPVCVTPAAQPTQLNLSANNTAINGYFTATTADGYLVVRSVSSSLSSIPVNGTTYTVGNSLGGGTVIANAAATAFTDNGLTSSTQYYYFVFARNSICTGGAPFYKTTSPLIANAATTAITVRNYYFGNLHAHSSYSDGNTDNTALKPADDYAYAKTSLCMDFLGISEHNHLMKVANYQPGISQAAAATSGNFLALYGMEYGVISNGGHVLIYGSNQLIGWTNANYDIYVPQSDYIGTPESSGTTGLFRTINNMNNAGATAFASFAHPDNTDYNNLANIAYNPSADSALLGCAVASGPAFSTSTTYNDPPASMAYLDYYVKMLTKGYHIGPFMDHDSHYTNFGRSSNNRLAVMATDLSSASFFAAMKARHFYSTEDCDTRVNFTINNEIMGSIISGSNAPGISVYAIDPTSPSSVPSIKIMYGVLGTGAAPTQLVNANGNSVSFTDNSLAIGATAYYYLDISIAGNRTITAPIWYTKTNPVPVTLLSFTANANSNRTVQLQWSTSNEINNQSFVVEKSIDGVAFFTINRIEAKNGVDVINNYSVNDNQSNQSVTYYRLKQLDKNGRFTYSKIVSINMKDNGINGFSFQQNPISDVLKLNINAINNTKVKLMITDITGRMITTKSIDLTKGFQVFTITTSNLKAGNYLASLLWNNELVTDKFIKW